MAPPDAAQGVSGLATSVPIPAAADAPSSSERKSSGSPPLPSHRVHITWGATASPEALPQANPGEVWYLAFGSNLNPAVLTTRRRVVPRASRAVKLDGLALSFNVCFLPYLEPGMATLVKVDPSAPRPAMPAKPIVTGAQAHQARLAAGLHGVAHLISASEWEMVKRTEGVRFKNWGYQVVPVTCETYDGQKIEALTLVAAPASTGDPAGILPSARYMNIIRDGARFHGLDPAYCDMLDAHPVYPNETWTAQLGQYAMLVVIVLVSLPLVPTALVSTAYKRLTSWGKPKPAAPPPPQPAAAPASQQPPAPAASGDAATTNGTNGKHPAAASATAEGVAPARAVPQVKDAKPPGGPYLQWLRQHVSDHVWLYYLCAQIKAMQYAHDWLFQWVLGSGNTVSAQGAAGGVRHSAAAAAGSGKHKAS